MPFVRRFYAIIDKVHHTPTQLWLHSTLLGALSASVSFLYLTILNAQLANVLTLNQALADAGMIMIGLSFALSGVCYFWDFFDTKIIYRKHIGLVGFWMIAMHGALTLTLPQFPLRAFFMPENIVAFLAAVASLMILIMMAAISNRYAIREIGGRRWRMLLRTGYIAYILGALHMVLKKSSLWSTWMQGNPLTTPPPLSLIIGVFAVLVIMLRLALACAIIVRRRNGA